MNANITASHVGELRPQELSPKQHFFVAAQQFREVKRPNNRLKVGENPRKFTREIRSFSVSLEPLNSDFDAIAKPIWVISRDLSPNGMGVISHDPIEHQYVRIGLPDGLTSVIGNVRHNTSIGHEYLLFLVGIEFID